MTEADESAAGRRGFRRPWGAVLAVLLLVAVGGSVWALSGGRGGSAAPSAAVRPTAQPSPTAAPTPTVTPTASETPVSPSLTPSPSATAEPVAAPATEEPAEPDTSAPAAPRKPTAKAVQAPAAKPQGGAPAPAPAPAKPKAPAAPAGQDPHDLAPVPCTNCRTDPQPGSGDCYLRGEAKVMVCGPVQMGTPLPRRPDPAFTPGSAH
ncbi:hypothetical protein ACFVXG_42070 [Kitasatospora sp. NPDC058162]|uniref:hypothetical protein n=1 Tax=Kitasatospora sp. NPDC058162 TaxID=3346362 RepID=UPI0036D9949B